MSFAEHLNAATPPPRLNVEVHEDGRVTFDGLQAEQTTEPDFSRVYEAVGLNPEEHGLRVQGRLGFSAWEQRTKDGETVILRSYRGTLVPVAGGMSPAEFQQILDLKGTPREPYRGSDDPDNYLRVTIIGDLQASKVDRYGGTRELAVRVNRANDRLREIYAAEPASELAHLDPGDAIEGFNSTASQKFLNDMSMPEQLEFSRRALTSMLKNALPFFNHIHVATCTSNHSAWREGRGYLGKPGDDFGIDIHRAVSEGFELAELPVTWHMPDPWQEFTVVNIDGVKMALTHGHRAKSERGVMDWWKGQIFAAPEQLTGTKLFVNGHWHHPYATVVGPGQWRLQSAAMEAGSSWFTNLTGESSYPGLVTLRIDKRTSEVRDLQFIEVPCIVS